LAKELSGKVAIVTGAARGIGRAIAEALVDAGARVHGFDIDQRSDFKASRYRHWRVDVEAPEQIESAVAEVAGSGRLDILVNNAGTHPPTQSIDAFSVDDFDKLVRLNLRSVFIACRAALPALRLQGGAIANMASAVGLYGQEGASTYCATKAGIVGLTKALAIDEAPQNVRVNAICPGAILTPLAREAHPKHRRKKIADWAWMGRWGAPEEVAQLVLFLCSARASFITGESIVVSGGAELGYGFKAKHYYAQMKD
jgi:NAD(P)-dependent dehydrogenase (short-subunit alcohol dehydrogenase family)